MYTRLIDVPKYLFIVARTSHGPWRGFDADKPPCDGATAWLIKHTERTELREAGHPNILVQFFLARGENHRVEGDYAYRDEWKPAWVVPVPDLISFVRHHGEIVLDIHEPSGLPRIEIYDDRRE